MQIDILTLLPELLEGPFSHSILKRAADKGIANISMYNIRDYATNVKKQVDDYQYGGGAGMVLMCEPLANAIETLQEAGEYDAIVYMTPDGKTWNQQAANQFSMFKRILILCGHYKGIDQRIRDKYITHEVSVGDFVLSGGELAAAIVCDSIIRLMPGVLNDETSALSDSFQDNLLAPPVYTRPAEWKGMKVPDVLLSGNDKLIEEWRTDQAYQRTEERRPDLLK